MKKVKNRSYNLHKLTAGDVFEVEFTNDDTSFEYSDFPTELETLLKNIKISVKYQGYKKGFDKIHHCQYFRVTVRSGRNSHTFDFTDSISNADRLRDGHDRESVTNELLYSLLVCMGGDYGIDRECTSFHEFCNMFGYDEYEEGRNGNSKEHVENKKLYRKCIHHAKGLGRVLKNDDIEYLPR